MGISYMISLKSGEEYWSRKPQFGKLFY